MVTYIVKNKYKKVNVKSERPKPLLFHARRIDESMDAHYRYDLLQGIRFPKGSVVIGYDSWRMLQGDVCNDDNKRWFKSMEDLDGKYEIYGVRENPYPHCNVNI